MKFFECCHHCPDTKRHPGCHDKCGDYIEQKKLFEEHKETEKKYRDTTYVKKIPAKPWYKY